MIKRRGKCVSDEGQSVKKITGSLLVDSLVRYGIVYGTDLVCIRVALRSLPHVLRTIIVIWH